MLQISLNQALDPGFHVALGEALQPFRDSVLFVASGQATHNMRAPRTGPGAGPPAWAQTFMDWLTETVTAEGLSAEERRARFLRWQQAPSAAMAHPRSEHLVPLLVAAGLAGGQPGQKLWDSWMAGHFSLASYLWVA